MPCRFIRSDPYSFALHWQPFGLPCHCLVFSVRASGVLCSFVCPFDSFLSRSIANFPVYPAATCPFGTGFRCAKFFRRSFRFIPFAFHCSPHGTTLPLSFSGTGFGNLTPCQSIHSCPSLSRNIGNPFNYPAAWMIAILRAETARYSVKALYKEPKRSGVILLEFGAKDLRPHYRTANIETLHPFVAVGGR